VGELGLLENDKMSVARSEDLTNGRTLRGVVETIDILGNEIEHTEPAIH
jgi:hypothetical protein